MLRRQVTFWKLAKDLFELENCPFAGAVEPFRWRFSALPECARVRYQSLCDAGTCSGGPLKQECRAHWLTENRLAINEYNKHVERHGTFGGHLSSL